MNKEELLNKIKEIENYNKEHITFSDGDHRYQFDGQEIYGVSHYISITEYGRSFDKLMAGGGHLAQNMPMYQERGKVAHLVSESLEDEFLKNGTMYMNINNKHPQMNYSLYINNYNKFLNKYMKGELTRLAKELMIFHNELYVVGTIDRLYVTKNGDVILLDIKTGAVQDQHWIQQLLYKKILEFNGIKIDDIWLLSLKDGHISKFNELQSYMKPHYNKILEQCVTTRESES